jgi:Mg2+/citrate symporter
MASIGKLLVTAGILITVIGLLCWGRPSVPILNRLGRLPGDIYLRRGNFSLYFPLTSAIVVSIVLSILLAWLRR